MPNQYPVAPGFGNISTTAMRYVPSVYSPRLLRSFYSRTVYGEIANTWHEEEIKNQGDIVYIRQRPEITIRTHRKGQALVNETPTTTSTSLSIDNGRYWSFADSKVDEAQSDLDYVAEWTDDASKRLKINVDTFINANVYTSAAAANQGLTAGNISGDINLGVSGTPLAVTKSNITDVIVDCGTVLDEQDVPEDDFRWIVLPSRFVGLLKQSDLKNADLTGDSVSPLRNGRVGEIDRFTVYQSNLLDTTTDGAFNVFNCIFGTREGISFASQLLYNRVIDNPNAFGRLYQGLQVFGFAVTKPEALGWLYAYKG